MRDKILLVLFRNRIVFVVVWCILSALLFSLCVPLLFHLECSLAVFAVCLLVPFSGYLMMHSWKFCVVFSLLFPWVINMYVLRPDNSWESYYLSLLYALAFIFLTIVISKSRANVGTSLTICALLIIAGLAIRFMSDYSVTSFSDAYKKSIGQLAILDIIFLGLSLLFFIVTIISKRRSFLNVLSLFKWYIVLEVVLLIFGGIVGCDLLAPGISISFLWFLFYSDYVLLTMWWHPGHYFKETIESGHRFDVYADDYRNIHTENVSKLSGEDSDYFTGYKIEEISHMLTGAVDFLDLGCGDGNTGRYIAENYKNVRYTGVDVSDDSIIKAKEMGLSECVFDVYDGSALPYQNNSFDIVYMACVLHHIPEDSRATVLKECLRVLRPEGKLIIFEHNPWNVLTCGTVDKCPFDEDAILIASVDARILTLCAGFAKTDVKYTLFMPRKGIFNKLLGLEHYLRWLPLGAQYYLAADKKGH